MSAEVQRLTRPASFPFIVLVWVQQSLADDGSLKDEQQKKDAAQATPRVQNNIDAREKKKKSKYWGYTLRLVVVNNSGIAMDYDNIGDKM